MRDKEQQYLEDKLVDEIELRLMQNIANNVLRSGMKREAEHIIAYREKVREYRRKMQFKRIADVAYKEARGEMQ